VIELYIADSSVTEGYRIAPQLIPFEEGEG